MLDDDLYIFPVRLEECKAPDRISKFNWTDLFGDEHDEEWNALLQALRVQSERLGKALILPSESLVEISVSKSLPKSITENLNGVPLEMILVPGGKFIMGGLPAGKFMMGGANYDDEKPQHEVVVPRFYIGKYQVTQKQWQVVMGKNPSRFKSEGLPVENISWNDAKEFCKKLSEITKREYRLPSEAEWEYACRAGTTGDYAGKLADMAWYAKNLGDNAHPVGKKKPNAFGLYDMHGNVWEWCEDVWHENYLDAPQDGSAWIEGGNNDRRVARGGSWNGNAHSCRSAFRINFDPVGCGGNLGLRIVASTRTL
jgi:formylglycine-generating enzyme required for sulfatase activity